jgi:hypothetical protein
MLIEGLAIDRVSSFAQRTCPSHHGIKATPPGDVLPGLPFLAHTTSARCTTQDICIKLKALVKLRFFDADL